MPEEEIYNNLVALDNGEVDVKTLIKRHNYNLCKKSVKTDKSIKETEEFTSLIEEKNNLNKALEKELQRTQKLISEEHARMQSIRIACRESKDCTAKLEKVTRDNKLTIDELRKSLHNAIDERNSLRRRLEEQCSKNSQLIESSAKQIEDHKEELSRLKKSFIHDETDNSMDTIDQRKKQVGRAEDTNDQSRKEFGRAEDAINQSKEKVGSAEVIETRRIRGQEKGVTVTRQVKLSSGVIFTMSTIYMRTPMCTRKQSNSAMVPSPTDQVETYSCWICQEEF